MIFHFTFLIHYAVSFLSQIATHTPVSIDIDTIRYDSHYISQLIAALRCQPSHVFYTTYFDMRRWLIERLLSCRQPVSATANGASFTVRPSFCFCDAGDVAERDAEFQQDFSAEDVARTAMLPQRRRRAEYAEITAATARCRLASQILMPSRQCRHAISGQD